jgi:hypothetical protein
MSVFYLENEELKGVLIDKGVLQEVNRSFFHPLGMALTIKYYEETDIAEIFLQTTNDDEGFIFTEIDSDKQRVFREFANDKYDRRQDEVGFIIQTHNIDSYIKKEDKKFDFKTERLKFILDLLQSFFQSIHFKFLKHSNDFDYSYTFPEIDVLKTELQCSYEDENWESVAAYSFLLNFHSKLEKEIEKLADKERNIKNGK